jgi:hypothetical protein
LTGWTPEVSLMDWLQNDWNDQGYY